MESIFSRRFRLASNAVSTCFQAYLPLARVAQACGFLILPKANRISVVQCLGVEANQLPVITAPVRSDEGYFFEKDHLEKLAQAERELMINASRSASVLGNYQVENLF